MLLIIEGATEKVSPFMSNYNKKALVWWDISPALARTKFTNAKNMI
jgi:hypothetical protein